MRRLRGFGGVLVLKWVARGEPKPIRRAFGVARGEPKPMSRAFGVARGEPKPIRRAFASPSWLRLLVHSRFRPPGCARLQGRLIRPGLTPRLRFGDGLFAASRRSAAGGGDEGRAGWGAQAGRVFGCRRHLGSAEAALLPEDPSRSLPASRPEDPSRSAFVCQACRLLRCCVY